MKRIGSWLAIGLLVGATAQAATPAPAACDRECLRSQMTQLLWSLVKHDSTRVPVAATVRITEDAVEKPLKDVALFRSVTALRGFRQDFIDERAGVALQPLGVYNSRPEKTRETLHNWIRSCFRTFVYRWNCTGLGFLANFRGGAGWVHP
jgi:hypothetical protein